METTFTGTTCGAMCWLAQEDVCRCSCGGANHGCLRGPEGVQPARTRRVKQNRFTLVAVGDYWAIEHRRYDLITRLANDRVDRWYQAVLSNKANDDLVARWPELAPAREGAGGWTNQVNRPCYLLWLRSDLVDTYGGKA